MLAALKDAGLSTAILSNGSPDMLAGAVKSAGIAGYLDDVLSVEDVGVFKPHVTVYDLVGKRFGTPPDAGALRFIQRLGCGGRRGLRISDSLGKPRGRTDGPPSLDPGACSVRSHDDP